MSNPEKMTDAMLQNIEKPDAIFFDWDGTLVNTIPGLFDAHNYVRVAMGFPPWSQQDFWDNLRHSSRQIYPSIYKDRTEEAFDILYDYMDKNHLNGIEIMAGTHDLIDFMRENAIKSGIISNKKHRFLMREVAHFKWNDVFPVAYGSGALEQDKPDATPLLKAFEETEQSLINNLGNVWYVGDTATDMMAAKNAGCKAVLLADPKNRDTLEKEFSPYLSLQNCGELHEILTRIF